MLILLLPVVSTGLLSITVNIFVRVGMYPVVCLSPVLPFGYGTLENIKYCRNYIIKYKLPLQLFST